MELLYNDLAFILSIIKDNFWQIFLIIVLLNNKKCWRYGNMLLFTQIAFGYKWYWYALICSIAFIVDIMIADQSEKTKYETEICELRRRLKDPDYK